ncbi:DUF418 domain-containing protein [Priestia megaterium]|uniref:DUF418 domain-containing protein n=1 Tax=Priestia megaterium TaxID=1404 RepID=UPI0035E22B88
MKKDSRIIEIDIIRGVSILGIFIVNILIFQYGLIGYEYIDFKSELDKCTRILVDILAENSFLPIFSFLFAYNLILFINKNKDRSLKWLLIRRFIFLVSLGFIHHMLLWEGDILLTYGLTGIVLLPFIRLTPKKLLYTISIISLLSIIKFYPIDNVNPKFISSFIEKANHIYQSKNYLNTVSFRFNEHPYNMSASLFLLAHFFTIVLSLVPYLLGIYAAKTNFFRKTNFKNKKLYVFSFLLFTLGIIIKVLPYLYPQVQLFGALKLGIGGVILGVSYILITSIIVNHSKMNNILFPLSYVGKTSFSNYILQSLFGTFLFYGYGFNQFSKLGVLNSIIIAFVFYIFQVWLSYTWLKHFKFGPLEHLWRIFIYQGKKSIKKEKAA